MTKGVNLYELHDVFRKVFQAHPLVNDFHVNKYRLNDTDDIGYPAVVFTVNGMTKNGTLLTYNINLLYADRLTDSRDNETNIQSIGTTVLIEGINAVSDVLEISVDNYTLNPFTEQFADNTAGVVATISVEAPVNIGECYWMDIECLECYRQ